MKVNVSGKGVIPGVRQILPAYNVDLEKDIVYKILGSNNISVYRAIDGLRITRKNIDEMFKNIPERYPNAMYPFNPPKMPKKSSIVSKHVEEPVIEQKIFPAYVMTETASETITETETTADTDVEESTIIEDTSSETVTEVETDVEETVGETVETAEETQVEQVEERPRFNKKKKKNRNNY